jgi:plasmid maintenance system antidote protein VapI
VTSTDLPKLMSRKDIAESLGVKLATAETIMRGSNPITIGRRVYVTDQAVADYLKKASSTSGGTS